MILGLTRTELWSSIIFLCVVGLIYFGRAILDAENAADSEKPFRWGDAPRRSSDEPVWLSHPLLCALTFLAVLFVLKMAL